MEPDFLRQHTILSISDFLLTHPQIENRCFHNGFMFKKSFCISDNELDRFYQIDKKWEACLNSGEFL